MPIFVIFIESLLIAVMVTVMIPISRLIYNFILRLRRRKTESESEKQSCQPAVDRVLKSMLSKLQNEVKTIDREGTNEIGP